MRLYLIAGEDSGDLHAANLVAELRGLHPDLEVRGIGGAKLRAQGMHTVKDIRDINLMGFWEVFKNLRMILGLLSQIKKDISEWKPDAIILIDYPGFNLRMAKFAKNQGIPVFYYISPQLWAWKKGRIETVRKYVDRMFVILPFEKDFYQKEGIEVSFLGHPLLDEFEKVKKQLPQENHPKPIIALLPGSRQQEIKQTLPIMLEMVDAFPEYRFVVAGAPSRTQAFYETFLIGSGVELWMNQTYLLLSQAHAALVTSGTATLETALFRVPQVVCYKGSAISYHIGKRLVQVAFISLVNLILGRKAVEELIQYDFNAARLKAELSKILEAETRTKMAEDYELLYQKLGKNGTSERVAQEISARLQNLSLKG